MSTINQSIYDVRERLNQLTDDSEISDRLILHRLNQVRSTFLVQHLNNFRMPTDPNIIQTLCLEVELVSSTICGVSVGCEQILRTKQKLPKIITKHTGPTIISITTPNLFSKSIEIINVNNISFAKYRYFKNTYAFLGDDNHIYLFSTKSDSYKLIDCITVKAVFYNPLDLENYKNCCGCENATSCFDIDTTEYPIIPEQEDVIFARVVETFIPKLEIPEDKSNNADDK